MYTIKDYLQYYKNATIKEVHWNAIDSMLCALLVYLPMETFKGCKTFKDFYEYAKQMPVETKESMMMPSAYEMLELAYQCPRYKDMKIYNWTNTKTEKAQFGAATFRINGETIVSFKGTDYSFIGWIENFRLAYEYPTHTHMLAIEYLKNNVRILGDKRLYVVGHSKGGNLAMVSAMECQDRIFNKIQKIYNFDGPGFRKDEFTSVHYEKMTKKLENIVPTGSVVGVLLNNNGYKVVKSGKMAVEEHNLASWHLFGECFIEGKLSSVSNRLHETTTKGIENLEYEVTKEALETVFESFEKDVTSDFSMSMEDLVKFVKNMKNVDPEVRKSVEKIFEVLLTANIVEVRRSIRLPWRKES